MLCGEGKVVPWNKRPLEVSTFFPGETELFVPISSDYLGHGPFELASLFPTHFSYFIALGSEIG